MKIIYELVRVNEAGKRIGEDHPNSKYKDRDVDRVMCAAMNEAVSRGDLRAAANYAHMAAPYIHPRLSTVNANHNGQVAVTIQVVSEFE